MIYFLSFATLAMLGYMMWRVIFSLRHDRVKTQRVHTRGKHAFRPKEKARFLLKRAFGVTPDKPEWEDPLLTSLAAAPVEPEESKKVSDRV